MKKLKFIIVLLTLLIITVIPSCTSNKGDEPEPPITGEEEWIDPDLDILSGDSCEFTGDGWIPRCGPYFYYDFEIELDNGKVINPYATYLGYSGAFGYELKLLYKEIKKFYIKRADCEKFEIYSFVKYGTADDFFLNDMKVGENRVFENDYISFKKVDENTLEVNLSEEPYTYERLYIKASPSKWKRCYHYNEKRTFYDREYEDSDPRALIGLNDHLMCIEFSSY